MMKKVEVQIQGKTAEDLRRMLLTIYQCDKPFTLKVSKRRCKTKLGSYSCENSIINIYNFSRRYDVREVAIHEYAHHINITEWWDRNIKGYRYEATHGYKFWFIYSELISMANEKGFFITPRFYGRAGLLFNNKT